MSTLRAWVISEYVRSFVAQGSRPKFRSHHPVKILGMNAMYTRNSIPGEVEYENCWLLHQTNITELQTQEETFHKAERQKTIKEDI